MKSEDDQELEFIATGRGKWSQLGVPHKGWTCIDIEDLGAPVKICDMCEQQKIRFLHYMSHPSIQGTYTVGCICAGKMEESLSKAKDRESAMKSRAGKRKRWLTRKWEVSTNGNDMLKSDGFRCTIFKGQYGKWGAIVTHITTNKCWKDLRYVETQELAKLLAFDTITKALQENPRLLDR